MTTTTHRFVIALDTDSLPIDALASFARDTAHVTFTNVAPIVCSHPTYSTADVCVAFNATTPDVLAYCDALDIDADVIEPYELHA